MRADTRDIITRKGRTAARGRRGGFALVVVLFIVVMMAVMVGSFSMRTSGSYRLARSRAASWRMYYAARAAVEEAKAKLWQQFIAAKEAGAIKAPPENEEYTVGGVTVRIVYEDEAGKLPINGFAKGDDARRKDLALILARLFDGLSVPNSTSVASAVRDFVDEDGDGLREQGAKNAALFDLCELLAVKGLSAEDLYGRRMEENPTAASILTTWHGGPVNLNTARGELMKAISARLTDAEVREIIAARAERPFDSLDDMRARTNVSDETLTEMTAWAGFSTDTMTLKAEARLGSFVRRIEEVIWLESTAGHTLYMREGWQD